MVAFGMTGGQNRGWYSFVLLELFGAVLIGEIEFDGRLRDTNSTLRNVDVVLHCLARS